MQDDLHSSCNWQIGLVDHNKNITIIDTRILIARRAPGISRVSPCGGRITLKTMCSFHSHSVYVPAGFLKKTNRLHILGCPWLLTFCANRFYWSVVSFLATAQVPTRSASKNDIFLIFYFFLSSVRTERFP